MTKELEAILDDLKTAGDTYDAMYLKDVDSLSTVLRMIMSANFYLVEYRVEAHERWLDVYNETSGTNAAKTRVADTEVKELYQIRHISRISEKVADSIRSQIGICRNQK
jgi:predicted outer membrane protein